MIGVFCSEVRKQYRELEADGSLCQFLSAERPEIQRLQRRDDRHRALAGEFLCRKILSSHTGLPIRQIQIQREPLNKPFLAGGEIFFSVSHSGQRVAVAVSSKEVAIDIERIRPRLGMEIVAASFFSQDERNELKRHEGQARVQCFFDIWTLKESFVKATGKGLSQQLDSFSIRFRNDGRPSLEPPPGLRWHLRIYRQDPDYRLAVCSELPEAPAKIEWV